jgi:tRNA A37 threonylcarbamoyltransferase TsaD
VFILGVETSKDSFSLSELDNEDFRKFKFISRSIEIATKKRKLNNGIIPEDDK